VVGRVSAALGSVGWVFYDAAIETLTFLSTDIEGSTALLRRPGDDAYAVLLAEHHVVVADKIRTLVQTTIDAAASGA
jgi:class 3 adenylate cyclase